MTNMNKMKQLFLILVIVLSFGCGGPYYFDLYLEPQKVSDTEKINKILFVDDIKSNEAYWTQRMVFRESPYQVEYFTYKQWAKSSGEVIKDAAVLYYKNSLMFKKVIEEYSSIEPDIILKTNIYAIELFRSNREWNAHLALDFEVIDKRTEKVILTYSFDRKKKIKGKKARYLPEKISEILQEELFKVTEMLKSKL